MNTKFYLARQPLGNEIDGYEPEPTHLYETSLTSGELLNRTVDYLAENKSAGFTPMNISSGKDHRYLMLIDRDSFVDKEGVAFWENLLGEITLISS